MNGIKYAVFTDKNGDKELGLGLLYVERRKKERKRETYSRSKLTKNGGIMLFNIHSCQDS